MESEKENEQTTVSGLDDPPCYDDLDGANAEEARLWDEFQAASKRRAEVVSELRSREQAAQDAWAKAYESRCSLRRQLTEMRERNSHHNDQALASEGLPAASCSLPNNQKPLNE